MHLIWLILIPFIGGLVTLVAGRWSSLAARWVAVSTGVIDLVLSIYLCMRYSMGNGIMSVNLPWIPQFGINFHLELDGLSMVLVLLTTSITLIAIIGSWNEITDRVGAFYFAILALQAGILGVFMAFDLLLFYLFWELMLIPMYFLIGIWGHENRRKAAIKFFLFTFISGLFMLIAMIGLYVIHGQSTGDYTFDYVALIGTVMPAQYAFWIMLGFFIGFAVKLPVWPFHTWLPDAHTEAPTAGSVILAGLMLKTGAYGLLRFTVPLFPSTSVDVAPVMMGLGVAGILYGAVLAFAQTDLKRMVAYSSVSHMGFVLLGIYAGNRLALQGVVVQIICHALSTGALFMLVGMIQSRTGTRDLRKLGGLWATAPRLGGFTIFFGVASLGLPGLGNFNGEFLVLIGTFQVNWLMASVASIGLVLSAIYVLRLVQASMLGSNEGNWDLPGLSARETLLLGAMALSLITLGLYPRPIFSAVDSSLTHIEQSIMSDTRGGYR